jgi:hypothetical protein
MRMLPQDCWGALHCWGALLRGALPSVSRAKKNERAVVAEDVEEDKQHAEGLDDDEDTAHRADDNIFGAVGRGTVNILVQVRGEGGCWGPFLNFCLLTSR